MNLKYDLYIYPLSFKSNNKFKNLNFLIKNKTTILII